MTIVALIAGIALALCLGIVSFIYSLLQSKQSMNPAIKTKALDVFLYLGIGISLVVSVINFITIFFRAIEIKFAIDPTLYMQDYYNDDIRLAVAFLVVMFPLYIFLSWYVSKDIQKFLYKRDLFIRRLFVYTALFVSVCTLIGSLVTSIYTYLGGDITLVFIYKALSIAGIASFLFGYYIYSLRRDYSVPSFMPLAIGVLVTMVMAGSIFWSITIIGTPTEMRLRKLDSTRLSDISRIQREVYRYFQTTEKLPTTTEQLTNAIQGYAVPVDPVTKVAYAYKVIQQPVIKMNYAQNKKELTSNGIFEICATFETERIIDAASMSIAINDTSMFSANTYYYEGDVTPFWNHKAETTCFKRVITPDMYYSK